MLKKKIRLIGPDGSQLGIMTENEAGYLANSKGLDLVEISPKANPPVVKLMDYGKFKYEQAKKEKKGTAIKLKEIKFRPRTDVGDIDVKVKKIIGFLNKGYRVKLVVNFRGREIGNPKLGFDVLDKVFDMIDGDYKIDKKPKLEGRNIVAIITC